MGECQQAAHEVCADAIWLDASTFSQTDGEGLPTASATGTCNLLHDDTDSASGIPDNTAGPAICVQFYGREFFAEELPKTKSLQNWRKNVSKNAQHHLIKEKDQIIIKPLFKPISP